MTVATDNSSKGFSQSFKSSTEKFADLGYVYQMYCYVNTISQLQAPKNIPPDEPTMEKEYQNPSGQKVPIPTLPDLITSAKVNASKWDSYLDPMSQVAKDITNWSKLSKSGVLTLQKRTNEELNAEKFATLTADRKAALKKEFNNIINVLRTQAIKYSKQAAATRDAIAAYKSEIEKDFYASKAIERKYKNWLETEATSFREWEQKNGITPGDTVKLTEKIREQINKTLDDISIKTTGQKAGTGSDVAAVFINFTFIGTIYYLVALNSDAVKSLRTSIATWQDQLSRIARYDTVNEFFKTGQNLLQALISACNQAIGALGGIQGDWDTIAAKLESLGQDIGTLDTLKGWGEEWSEPISDVNADLAVEDFDTIIKTCDMYVRYLYVKDLNVTASSTPKSQG